MHGGRRRSGDAGLANAIAAVVVVAVVVVVASARRRRVQMRFDAAPVAVVAAVAVAEAAVAAVAAATAAASAASAVPAVGHDDDDAVIGAANRKLSELRRKTDDRRRGARYRKTGRSGRNNCSCGRLQHRRRRCGRRSTAVAVGD